MVACCSGGVKEQKISFVQLWFNLGLLCNYNEPKHMLIRSCKQDVLTP
jgi:hypothetical protein